MKNNFEEYLKSKHAEEYSGTDDDMPDAFEAWIIDMGVERLIDLGELYGMDCKIAGLKEAQNILEKHT